MLHYSETGKTKSGEIKITRPVFALLVTGTGSFADLVNEKISVDIERNQGSTTSISNQQLFTGVFPVSAHGVPAIKSSDTKWEAIFLLAMGAIPLKDSESIKVNLTDLRAGETYTVSSIESPNVAVAPLKYDSKIMVSDDTAREIDIRGFRKMHVNNLSVISQIRLKHISGVVNTYEVAELKALSELDDPYYLNESGLILMSPPNAMILDVSEVTHIEIVKAGGTAVRLTLGN